MLDLIFDFLHLSADQVTDLFVFSEDKVTYLFISITLGMFLFLAISIIIKSRKQYTLISNTSNKIASICSDDSGEVYLGTDKLYEFKGISRETSAFSTILLDVNGKLYATQDVESAVESLWSPSLLQNRFFPAGAAILTGLGVLGTFVGLLLGLSGLHLDGNMQNLQSEIRGVAQGASVAFETSVWGVALSLILTLCEKYSTERLSRHFHEFQKKLSEIFPPLPIAHVLIDQRDHARESSEALKELAERIGNSLQQHLSAATRDISQNLQDLSIKMAEELQTALSTTLRSALLPLIQELTGTTREISRQSANGAEKALEQLLETFMERMGEQGSAQRQLMESSAQNVHQLLSGFSSSMNDLLGSIHRERESFSKEQAEQRANQHAVLEEMGKAQIASMSKASEEIFKALEAFRGGVGEELQKQTSTMQASTASVQASMTQSAASLQEFLTGLKNEQESQRAFLNTAMQNMGETQRANVSKAGEEIFKALEAFRGGVGKELQKQTSTMQASTASVQASMTQSAASLQEFLTGLKNEQESQRDFLNTAMQNMGETQIANVSKASEEIFKALSAFRGGVGEELQKQTASMQKTSDSVQQGLAESVEKMQKFLDNLQNYQQLVTNDQDARNKRLQEELGTVSSRQSAVLDQINTTVQGMISASSSLLQQGEQLQSRIAQDNRNLKEISGALVSSTQQMNGTTVNLQQFNAHLRETLAVQQKGLQEARLCAQETNRQFADLLSGLQAILVQMRVVSKGMEQTTSSLSSAADTASKTYGLIAGRYHELQLGHEQLRKNLHDSVDAFASQMKQQMQAVTQNASKLQENMQEFMINISNNLDQQVVNLDKKMADLLKDFTKITSAQMNDRMSEWDRQTRNFCDKMVATVEAMGEVVESLDTLPRR